MAENGFSIIETSTLSSCGYAGAKGLNPVSVLRRLLALQEEVREAQLPPQERVQAVRPFWETLSQEQRVQLLSLGLEELRAKAAEVTAPPEEAAFWYACFRANAASLLRLLMNLPCCCEGSKTGSGPNVMRMLRNSAVCQPEG